ncbi:uncharacterized protein LOC112574012 [Pomacea canaliculata]|uniref:uncharacterized protein LOC112574012 n=1 Tax=Pomacea canaliculata TaxID=400727 RepID=UPI000D725649|nr:uncharacterized protein LOC112574012 [Pomacea canaliculata]XP_025110580.1 uncharacterized protein LOC112574012 [Pomacea canaliculata]
MARSNPILPVVRFAGQNTLQIVCSFQFCFTREDVLCTDRCNTRRMARLTTTSYWDTTTYDYWTSTSPLYRKKREANSTEFATAQVQIITEYTTTDTKQTASMAATNTVGPITLAMLLILATQYHQ